MTVDRGGLLNHFPVSMRIIEASYVPYLDVRGGNSAPFASLCKRYFFTRDKNDRRKVQRLKNADSVIVPQILC